jgi:hypothetical protein
VCRGISLRFYGNATTWPKTIDINIAGTIFDF